MHFGKARRYDYLTVRRCVFQNKKKLTHGIIQDARLRYSLRVTILTRLFINAVKCKISINAMLW